MSWKKVWRDHVKKTNDFWVDRSPDPLFDEKEKQHAFRKKDLFQSREAQILKSTINGAVLDYQKVDDEDHIRYQQHLSLLINHNTHEYLEELTLDKEVIFQGETLKEDRMLNHEGISTDPDATLDLELEHIKNQERFSYDREAVIAYADMWWNDYNPDYPKFEVDCTNYVSQCMRAGGAPMTHIGEKNKGWWCKEKDCSYSWSVANALRLYLSTEGNSLGAVAVDDPSELEPGDVICYDWEGDGKWNHNTIVVGKDWDDMPLVNAHTTNSRNRYWSYEDSPAFTENTLYLFFHIGSE